MNFKYFDNAEVLVGLRDIKTTCNICSKNTLCFDAELFYGIDEISSICPQCLAEGHLKKLNMSTCDGDIGNLIAQLKQLYVDLKEEEIQQIARDKTTELETTTPHLVTWQDWKWPASDGDYCKFIGYGSKPFYKELAKHISVEYFFKSSFYVSESYNDDLWPVVPDKAIGNYADSEQYGTLFYVFKSLNSDKIVTRWDCD